MSYQRQLAIMIVLITSMLRRSVCFTVRRPTLHRSLSALHSTAPWLSPESKESTDTIDSSAISKSRTPFRMPRNAEDDSVPKGEGGVLAWTKLGLLSELVESVYDDQGLSAPTPVQQIAIPELLKEPPMHLAFLAATGSGKTLAYALPLLQMIKSQEMFQEAAHMKPKRPKILILAPTRELAVQLTSVIKQLCHRVKLSAQSVIGSEDYGKQRKALNRRVDIVVATPGRLLKHWDAGNVYFGDVQHVVVDEMDTMLEQGFQVDLQKLLHPMLYKQKGNVDDPDATVEGAPRIILTSATMTQAITKLIGNKRDETVGTKKHFIKLSEDPSSQEKAKISLPNIQIMKAPGLHKVVPRLQQVFVDVGNVDKLSLLSDVVHSGGRGAAIKRSDLESTALTIVFCNTVSSARAAQHALAEAGIPSLSYHGELNSAARTDSLNRFRSAGAGNPDEPSVIVCTDLAARGLDIPEVDHVVMFDFPLNALDYLHRSGRTARGVSGERKGNGRVTALVTKRDRVLATGIENAVQKGESLDGLSSRKSDYIPSRARGNTSNTYSSRRGGKSNSSSSKSRSPSRRKDERGSPPSGGRTRGRSNRSR